MSSISVTCPQEIRALNHKVVTGQYWNDPEYQAIAAEAIRGKACEYCGRPAEVVHHDSPRSYHTKEGYYNPENMTPCCNQCHAKYRKGLRICPECKQHYHYPSMHDKCQYCRGDVAVNKFGRQTRKNRSRHPCSHRIGQQRCQRNGKLYVCARPAKSATGCDYYEAREVEV